jgi:hypothetical protein
VRREAARPARNSTFGTTTCAEGDRAAAELVSAEEAEVAMCTGLITAAGEGRVTLACARTLAFSVAMGGGTGFGFMLAAATNGEVVTTAGEALGVGATRGATGITGALQVESTIGGYTASKGSTLPDRRACR